MTQYTITEMAKQLKENRVNVMRKIESLNLKELNTDRPYKNSPKYYDEKTFNTLKKEYNYKPSVKQKVKQSNTKNMTSNTDNVKSDTPNNNDEIVKMLKEQLDSERKQLEHERERVKDISERNKELISLVDQQQRLTLMYNDKVKALEIELKDVKEPLDTETDNQLAEEVKTKSKKNLFSRLFNRK